MCGIAGFLDLSATSEDELHTAIVRMTATLSHRGPDDQGLWIDKNAGVALGHRRLSILDLSPEGHQPMFSEGGRYAIVFNGEIYNFQELRSQLNANFRGHSDTEVMLAAFERWGVEQAVLRFNGMFAFALWDRQQRSLFLGRDRLGEKPLYYGWLGKSFVFGSELKALRAHPAFNAAIDPNAVAAFFRHKYVPTPNSIYKGIVKLPPGTLLCLNAKDGKSDPAPVAYWSARTAAEQGTKHRFHGSEQEAIEQLNSLLADAVKIRMVADVALGAFLSGGIDSSTVVSLMQAQSSRPVKTFSIGFHEAGYNEAVYAAIIARHLGTDHTELYVSSDEAMSVIPQLPLLYDEPFADASQIPTYLVSKLARRDVTVSLSGDGGDEVFGGYTRYFWGQRIWNSIRRVPGFLRRPGASTLTALSPEIWNRILRRVAPFLPQGFRQSHPGDKLHKLGAILKANAPETMYLELISVWKDPLSLVPGAYELPTIVTKQEEWLTDPEIAHKMMFLDTVTYLPDDILVKLDRASMGVSLESRVPFLDHRVVEFAWQLPIGLKVRPGQGKWLLRQVLDKYVPRELVERPKIGFGVPIHAWLRGPLREWAESLIEPARLRREGYLNPEPIQRKWSEHLSGRNNCEDALWSVLMFQAWMENELCTQRANVAQYASFKAGIGIGHPL